MTRSGNGRLDFSNNDGEIKAKNPKVKIEPEKDCLINPPAANRKKR